MKLRVLASHTLVWRPTEFPSLFRTHALPLPGGRFLRPRMSRGAGAERLRNSDCSWPHTRPIRELKQPPHRAHKRNVRVRERCATANNSWQQARSQAVRIREVATAVTVRESALAMGLKSPLAIRRHNFSIPANPAKTLTIRQFLPATNSPRHRSVQPTTWPTGFPNRIQAISCYEHV